MNCPACGTGLATIKTPIRIPRYCFTCRRSMPTKERYKQEQTRPARLTPEQLLKRIGHMAVPS